MTEIEYSQASEATELCKACGLCCTGHLFSWVRLKAVELTPLEKLGLNVIRSDPRQRGFTQPCPMWNGICTIYESPQYPRGCDSYKCKLLRELLDESVSLPKALRVVKQAKAKIQVVENLLPASSHSSFRDRFVDQLEFLNKSRENDTEESELRIRAGELLDCFENQFGVKDLLDLPEIE
ncbi:MAG: hypothetical protein IPP66_16695 [Anaerolineales bacterium]|nr:hypothetical protein [Anaerolineales bacterium]